MRTIRTISFSKKATFILDNLRPKNVSDFVSKCVEASGGSKKILAAEYHAKIKELIELSKELNPNLEEISINVNDYL